MDIVVNLLLDDEGSDVVALLAVILVSCNEGGFVVQVG